jgi:serine-type D-Ala-D-Ala carboxypeptidase/endopeptidase (penicillin-binding protein 4)
VLAAGCAAKPSVVHPRTVAAVERKAPAAHAADRSVRQLRADLEAIFGAPLTRHAQWGVLVRSIDTGELLYELDADKLMMPASNMKIVTVAAAAHVIGWDARFTTTLETTAPIGNGALHGDLVVRGGGDPTLNTRESRGQVVFSEWAQALKAQGIHAIHGRIVGDDRLFDTETLGTGWAWDDLHNAYAAPVGALQFNQNTIDLTISPGMAPGEPASIQLGADAGLTVWNRLVTTTSDVAEAIAYRRRLDRPVLEVSGTVPLPSRPGDGTSLDPLRVRQIAVTDPTRYFVQSLKDTLVAHGIAVRGDAVAIGEIAPLMTAADETTWRVLARSESPPLREIAAVLLKVSQNLYAESVLKSLGAARTGVGTTAAGRTAVHSVLQEWNIDGSALIMADGSGLSRYNYASPALLVRILETMYSDPRHRDAFVAALPIAGRDGTVENRMRRSRAEGNATAKTGSLSNVRALSGYVRTRDGEMLVFSMVANSFAIPAPTITWIADLGVEVLANLTRVSDSSRARHRR